MDVDVPEGDADILELLVTVPEGEADSDGDGLGEAEEITEGVGDTVVVTVAEAVIDRLGATELVWDPLTEIEGESEVEAVIEDVIDIVGDGLDSTRSTVRKASKVMNEGANWLVP